MPTVPMYQAIPLTELDGDERLLRVTFEDGETSAGWVAIAVYEDGACPVLLEALMAEGETEAVARERLAALPAARCGEGGVQGPLDYTRGYIAVDAETGLGVVEVFGDELGQALRLNDVSEVTSPKGVLMSALREVQTEAAELAGEEPPEEEDYWLEAPDDLA